jgi:putative oxygen-independent coproporphyrinogen III oxidase
LAGPLPLGLPWPESNQIESQRDCGSFHAYVHIPFCSVRCGYCDFNTYTASEIGDVSKDSFHFALLTEIENSKSVLERSGITMPPLSSVFFGGGTPSLMQATQIGMIISALRAQHGIAPGVEITLEANPDNITTELVAELSEAGVTRISVGVQSFDRDVLKVLDRTHDPRLVEEAINTIKAVGMDVSLDLIFGAPGESLEAWLETVDRAIALRTDHISAYSLIVEPGTKLAKQIQRGVYPDTDEDLNASKYEEASKRFIAAGLDWYEVSNFGKPSLHNQAYWQSRNWWGFGPGAHSHISGNRFWNRKHPLAYQQALETNSQVMGMEVLTQRQHLEERLLLELRTSAGVPRSLLKELEVLPAKVSQALSDGLLTMKGPDYLVVTDRGRLLVDGITVQFLT